ncbi:MAG: hypothetical protein ACK41T_07200 [Pseudobdellovibrio sp.]
MKNTVTKVSNSLGALLLIAFIGVYSQFARAQFSDTKKETHPGAQADGLIRIDKDGNYIYQTEPQNAEQASHIRIGTVSNPDISVDVCDQNGQNCAMINFDDIYKDASGIGLEYDYEYFLFRESGVNFGKLGLQGGVSVNLAQGHGRLVANPQQESIESFTFITMPVFAGLIYRFEYKDRQMFVPYGSGGGVYTVLAEKREDKSKIKAIGGFGFYFTGGALLNLSAIDREMGADFSTEYGIKNLWLSAEYKYINVENDAFSLSNGYVQGGLGFDF